MIDNIYEHIRKAQLEAQKQHIKANMIIIDTDLAIVNGLCFPENETSYKITPPIIMGLEIKYHKHLAKDLGVNFAITEGKSMMDEIFELKAENYKLKEKLRKLQEVLNCE